MNRSPLLAALRIAVVTAGLVGLLAVAAFAFDLPPPPETGDGLPSAFGFAIALLGAAVAGVVAVVGYGLPAGTGRLRVGPLADRSSEYRLVAGGAAAAAVGLVFALGLAFLASGTVSVAVWVVGVGLLVGGVVAVALGGLVVASRLVAEAVRERTGARG
ncbi:hypothetical protein Hbl1158_12955 [Halobaculum sp. CBA1158]|uniref:hypothetical protein n=1 Tax=Halobaculum sp. CBA1158 TaxID=2904243 RepID=UPI001F1A7A63|nr:hypothetical protein [Halobaculum sp. CBA1158]UIO99423.1 hypothetical protein Hbl1158_12955 [Halobaculum sp. CBA1158]